MRGCATVILGICAVILCVGLVGAVLPGIPGFPFGRVFMPLTGGIRGLLLLLALIVIVRLLVTAARSGSGDSGSRAGRGGVPAGPTAHPDRSAGAAGANGKVPPDVLRDYEKLGRRIEVLETILMERTGRQ